MIIIHFAISFIIWLFLVLPCMLIAWPILAIMLLTSWDGRTYFFGNSKWGRATTHYLAPTNGVWWKELLWMAWRNPVYNLGAHTLAIKTKGEYDVAGDEDIGDKVKGGSYWIRMGWAWEYYIVIPYTIFGSRRCVRVRVGWKISKNSGPDAEIVFAINPWKAYAGA